MITKEKQVERLFNDWKSYGKIVIAVDADDTIIPYNIASQGDCDEVIQHLKKAQEIGAYISLHTSCGEERKEELMTYCHKKGLDITGYNSTVIDVPWGRPGSKQYANIYIDDRGSIIETLDILDKAKWKYIGHLRSQKPLTEIG